MLETNDNNNELENYGVWVKSGPEDIVDDDNSPASEDFEMTDLENETSENDFLLTKEEETLLGSLEDDITESEEELYDIQDHPDMNLNEEKKNDDISDEEFIDIDIPDSIEENYNITELEDLDEKPVSQSDSQNSIRLLTEIANDLKSDLSAIKNELKELKKGLLINKYEEVSPEAAEGDEETPPGGFFSDDGDETIALTGDELDNIFNTAEITEEEIAEGIEESISEELIVEEKEVEVEETAIEVPEVPEVPEPALTGTEEETAFEENIDELSFLDGNMDAAGDTEKTLSVEDLNTDLDFETDFDENLAEESGSDEINLSEFSDDEISLDDITLDLEDEIDTEEINLDILEGEPEELSVETSGFTLIEEEIEEEAEEELSLDDISLDLDTEIQVEDKADESILDEISFKETEEAAVEDISFDEESGFGDVSLDLDEAEAEEAAVEDISFDDESDFGDVSLDLDEAEAEISESEDFTAPSLMPSDKLVIDSYEENDSLAVDEIITEELTVDEPVNVDLVVDEISTVEETSAEKEIEEEEISFDGFDIEEESDIDEIEALEEEEELPEPDEILESKSSDSEEEFLPADEVIDEVIDEEISFEDEIIPEVSEEFTDEDVISVDDILSEAQETEELSDASKETLTEELESLEEEILDFDEAEELEEEPSKAESILEGPEEKSAEMPENIKTEIKSVLLYLDQLLESLPENKIEEFAKSDHFKTYKKLFEELGLI